MQPAGGHHCAKTYGKMVPYHFTIGFSGQKKASILKPRNFCDQFWNLQLKGYRWYPGLYLVL